ncbi:hypothetical protein MNVI_12990 [Mycobacterium noviomagense]|uniref:Uncharacterized protein n=1 Tax=Mycobacterium noviomagense TaxID=459858 RepID=A0A7I7PBI3_9MYCO|nr:hypothetical protein MNVI_12990 [Mycobacterium noviomagense]
MQQPARRGDRHAYERDHNTDKHKQFALKHDQPATWPVNRCLAEQARDVGLLGGVFSIA